MFDEFSDLAAESSLCVAFLASADGSELEVLPVRPYSLPPEEVERRAALWAPRSLRFIGAAGLSADGKPRSVFLVPLSAVHIDAIAAAFCAYCQTPLEARRDDSADWLQRLWDLPDTRA
jgi:hypothetical protein